MPFRRVTAMRPTAVLALLLATTAVAVGADVTLKRPCVDGVWANNFQFRHLCYNDLQPLYYVQHLDRRRVPYVDQVLAYPTGTGTVMYLTALLSHSDRSFYWWNAAVLLSCALLATWALWASGFEWRVLLFAAAPSLVLCATLNWDLLAVAALAGGLREWDRGRYQTAGLLFGLGAAAKIFPGVTLLTGTIALIVARRRRDAAVFAGAIVAAILAWNVPYIIANRTHWFETWSLQAHRFPDYGTVWYWIWRAISQPSASGYLHVVDTTSITLLAALVVSVSMLQVLRHLSMPAATGVLLAGILVISKVLSPQYALWMLCFFVVIPGSWPYWLMFEAASAAVFVAGFEWDPWAGPTHVATGWQTVFVVAVAARAAALIATALHFARAGSGVSIAIGHHTNDPAVASPGEVHRKQQIASDRRASIG